MKAPWRQAPNERLDYTLLWGQVLVEGETIASSVVVTEPDEVTFAALLAEAMTTDGQDVTFWLSGGQDGASYTIYNRVVTTAQRVFERCKDIVIGYLEL